MPKLTDFLTNDVATSTAQMRGLDELLRNAPSGGLAEEAMMRASDTALERLRRAIEPISTIEADLQRLVRESSAARLALDVMTASVTAPATYLESIRFAATSEVAAVAFSAASAQAMKYLEPSVTLQDHARQFIDGLERLRRPRPSALSTFADGSLFDTIGSEASAMREVASLEAGRIAAAHAQVQAAVVPSSLAAALELVEAPELVMPALRYVESLRQRLPPAQSPAEELVSRVVKHFDTRRAEMPAGTRLTLVFLPTQGAPVVVSWFTVLGPDLVQVDGIADGDDSQHLVHPSSMQFRLDRWDGDDQSAPESEAVVFH